ncbi:MAG: Na+/H+ antiporter subunit E [Actinophytocola sp.]|nr:Na+/H+ antiporter subunit E [Actinophytocola sp.]
MTRWRLSHRLPTVLWLVAVWLLVWWELTPFAVASGIAVAVAVVVLFPLPDVAERLVVRPIPLLLLAGYVLADVAVSGVRVGWDALRHGGSVSTSIVAVDLLSDDDMPTAIAASLLTLSPGTFVVEIDRARRRYYVHALGTAGSTDVSQVRRTADRLQRLVLGTFGARGDVDVREVSR